MGRSKLAGLFVFFSLFLITPYLLADGIELPFDYFHGRWIEGHLVETDASYENDHEWHNSLLSYSYLSNSFQGGASLERKYGGNLLGDNIHITVPSIYLKYRPFSKLQLNFESFNNSKANNADYSESDFLFSSNYISTGTVKIADDRAAYSYLVKPFISKGTITASAHAYRGRITSPEGWRPASSISFPQFINGNYDYYRNTGRPDTQQNISQTILEERGYELITETIFGYDRFSDNAFDYNFLSNKDHVGSSEIELLTGNMFGSLNDIDEYWSDGSQNVQKKQIVLATSLTYGISNSLNASLDFQYAKTRKVFDFPIYWYYSVSNSLEFRGYTSIDQAREQVDLYVQVSTAFTKNIYLNTFFDKVYRKDIDYSSSKEYNSYVPRAINYGGSLTFINNGDFESKILLDDYVDYYHQMLAGGQYLLSLSITHGESGDIYRFHELGEYKETEVSLIGSQAPGKHINIFAGLSLIRKSLLGDLDYLRNYELEMFQLTNLYFKEPIWSSVINFGFKFRSYNYEQDLNSGWNNDDNSDIQFGANLKAWQLFFSSNIIVYPKGEFIPKREYPGISRNFAENIQRSSLNQNRPFQTSFFFDIGLGKEIVLNISDERILEGSNVVDALSKISLNKRVGQLAELKLNYITRHYFRTNSLFSAGFSVLF